MKTATRVINLVEHDLRHQTVQKAALEMEKVVELSDGQQECLLSLLATVATRWRGMLPVFSTVANQRNELLELQERQRRTERERDAAVTATSRAEQIATEAVRTTEQVHEALQAAKTEVETLQQASVRSNEAYKEDLAAKQKRIDWLFASLNAFKAKEAKQKAEIEELREKVQEATRLREAAESQLVDLEVDYEPVNEQSLVVLPDDSQAAFDLSGSQATFERLPGTTRKRKGSEDDLAWCDAEQASDLDDQPPRAAPTARKQMSKAAKPKAPLFQSDWHLPSGQVQPKGARRMLQRSTSANTSFPIALDQSGKPLKPVQVGSRKRMRGIS
ncbi:hypothetical protein TRAPUB_6081 [Trametes pubescens]|uniref:Uncharacterized protein n=1 Tax=Trametes pubescens TaxID=154538 RepID=A0A1M2V6U2_TRAPU|nr:hypothetical protein TRAPUB_6081 [Trametes pubescens]